MSKLKIGDKIATCMKTIMLLLSYVNHSLLKIRLDNLEFYDFSFKCIVIEFCLFRRWYGHKIASNQEQEKGVQEFLVHLVIIHIINSSVS